MPDLNLHVLLTFVLYAAITGVLNLLLSERSRVDTWAESHPKLAALLKLLRGLGLDPWHIVAAVSLFFKGKLPGGTGGDGPSGGGGSRPGRDPEPTRIRATGSSGFNSSDAAMVRWGLLGWRIRALMATLCVWVTMVALLCLAVVAQGCDPRKPPCDESKLRAIDERYIERVTVVCLPRYDRKEDCPEWPALQADHRRELRQECPQ